MAKAFTLDLDNFIEQYLTQAGVPVPARLQSLLALTERLYEYPTASLGDHLARSGQSLQAHETFGNRVHARLGLGLRNKNHGRRSSNLQDWGQPFLSLLDSAGFFRLPDDARRSTLKVLQDEIAEPLRKLLREEPIQVRCDGRSIASIMTNILDIADDKNRIAAVSQYLVGAKLRLRFPDRAHEVLARGSNLGDRRSGPDQPQRRGDFDLGPFVFEVSAGRPDTKHLQQVEDVLEDRHTEMWLLVRGSKLQQWVEETRILPIDHTRLVVTSIEMFIGQNLTELGQLDPAGQRNQLTQLLDIYHDCWVTPLGSPDMRVELK